MIWYFTAPCFIDVETLRGVHKLSSTTATKHSAVNKSAASGKPLCSHMPVSMVDGRSTAACRHPRRPNRKYRGDFLIEAAQRTHEFRIQDPSFTFVAVQPQQFSVNKRGSRMCTHLICMFKVRGSIVCKSEMSQQEVEEPQPEWVRGLFFLQFI